MVDIPLMIKLKFETQFSKIVDTLAKKDHPYT